MLMEVHILQLRGRKSYFDTKPCHLHVIVLQFHCSAQLYSVYIKVTSCSRLVTKYLSQRCHATSDFESDIDVCCIFHVLAYDISCCDSIKLDSI